LESGLGKSVSMFKNKKSFAWVAALGLLLMAGGAAHAQAAAQPLLIGVVDEDKLADGFTKYKNAVDALDQKAQNLDKEIPAREFLTDAEGTSFDTLIMEPTLGTDDQKTLDGLVKSGMDRRATYMGLVGQAVRSDQEAANMKDLQDTMTKNGPALRKLSDDLLAAIRKQQDDTDAQYTTQANNVVAQVAQDRKLALVVRKRAVVWSTDSIDITAEVLDRLNKAQ